MKTIQYWGLVLLVSVCLASCCKPRFVSISPEEVQQETSVQMVLTAKCTFFQDDGVDDIIISPSDGLTVSNITVKDNTTVEFDLEIAVDTPLGAKTVTVLYDNGNQFVVGVAKLTVVE